MRLTKLELNGFKSFARKTEIAFGNGVTAVIGPNGSGKSNIADSIKWVLGEQSARQLRGSKMEDVIFAGTQSRRPVSLCEVTLTFDNSDGKLNIPYQEVAVTRRVYRNGEGEYELNGTSCRLKDILDLFRDTGIGKDGYSIVGQGKVDEVLSNKSGERRAAIEEAAGVMRYRVRKEEAVRKLEKSRQNLERLSDIRRELEERLGPLEEQSRTAREYLKLRDELRDIEVNLFLYQYDKAQERLNAVEKALEACTADEEEAEASSVSLQEECAILEDRISGMDATLQEQQNTLMEMLSGVESHQGEARVLQERLDHADERLSRLEDEYRQASTDAEALQETLDSAGQDDAGIRELESLETEIAASEAALSDRDAALVSMEEELENRKNALMDALNRLADARSGISRFEAMEDSIHNRLDAIAAERLQGDDGDAVLEAEWKQAGEDLATLLTEREQLAAELAQARENRTALEKKRADTMLEQHGLEKESGSVASRLRVLREMAKSREGYMGSIRSLMNDAERDRALSDRMVGVVAELLHVPKQYEQAVTMALGTTLQNIVTKTADDAKYCIGYLRRHDYGRATFLPMEYLHVHRPGREERALVSGEGVLGFAAELVTAEKEAEDVKDFVLARTVIVRDLDAGIALRERAGSTFQIATLNGDIIATGGSMSGGSQRKQGFSLLSRERELKELDEKLTEIDARLHSLQEELKRLDQELILADTQTEAFVTALHEQDMAVSRQQDKNDIIKRDLERAHDRARTFDEEEQRLRDSLADIAAERARAMDEQASIESGNTLNRGEISAMQKQLSADRRQRDADAEALSLLRVRHAAMKKDIEAARAERARLEKRRSDYETSMRMNRTEAALVSTERQDIMAKLQEMLERVEAERADTGDRREKQQALEEERAGYFTRLTELRRQREEMLEKQRLLAERRHKQEIQKERTCMELSSMQDKLFADYELTYENALPLRHDIAIGASNDRARKIHAIIHDMGDINVGAIDDYKAVSDRYQEMQAQCGDLEKAIADLDTLVAELTRSMEKQFTTQFEVIRQNFDHVFTELFGGGHAELRLADRNSPLDCDIDIIAQPPGKKLQLLSLLSGGERALTAIALVFAMLQLKPPAFCLLDEIESSLDEVNVSRFANYVKHYSGDTQFILITHRKGSMEVCDSLYGVSMEEKGVSKVVSARFSE